MYCVLVYICIVYIVFDCKGKIILKNVRRVLSMYWEPFAVLTSSTTMYYWCSLRSGMVDKV